MVTGIFPIAEYSDFVLNGTLPNAENTIHGNKNVLDCRMFHLRSLECFRLPNIPFYGYRKVTDCRIFHFVLTGMLRIAENAIIVIRML